MFNRRSFMVGAAAFLSRPAFAQSQYEDIAGLNYFSDNTQNGSPASCAAGILQMQNYLITGQDVQLSTWFILTTGDNIDGRGGQITAQHGISSPTLLMEICRTNGTCPLSMCKTPSKLMQFFPKTLTSTQKSEALKYRSGYNFLTLNDIPDYEAALAYLSVNHGSAVLLTTDGYQAYSIIGVDPQGKGIWLDYYKTSGKPKVSLLDVAEGTLIWNNMIYGNRYGGPENYMIVFTKR